MTSNNSSGSPVEQQETDPLSVVHNSGNMHPQLKIPGEIFSNAVPGSTDFLEKEGGGGGEKALLESLKPFCHP